MAQKVDQARTLSLDEGIQLRDELIKGYMARGFQDVIWRLHSTVGKQKSAWPQARSQACQTVQFPVMEKFGFEPSQKGVADCEAIFAAEMKANPIIEEKDALVNYLIEPSVQRQIAKSGEKAPKGVPPSRISNPNPEEWSEATGTGNVWVVVGGGDKGGIVVRCEKSLKSAQEADRLATDAMIEEVEISADRMKYVKMDGSGPSTGWISLEMKGQPLVEPLYFETEGQARERSEKEWTVVHDRVAKREKPMKDAKVLGAASKDDVVSGTVIEVNGVPWLRTKAIPGVADSADSYMMIDGTSVGLGTLLVRKSQRAPVEDWKVVHTRVAKRATPSKDGEMVGYGLKDEIIKGTAVDEDGIQWLKTKAARPNNPDVTVDAYMMIDGESVGLGILLEKC